MNKFGIGLLLLLFSTASDASYVIKNGSVTASKLASNAVTTAKILDANITNGKMASNSVGTSNIIDANITNGKMAANSVGTSNIIDGNVTKPKLAALGQQVSSSSGNFVQSGTGSHVQVTNLSVTLTTTGRPVFVGIIPDNSGSSYIGLNVNGGSPVTGLSAALEFYEGSTLTVGVPLGIGGASSNGLSYQLPVNASMIVFPSAGTYTYSVKVSVAGSTTNIAVSNAQLLAYEL